MFNFFYYYFTRSLIKNSSKIESGNIVGIPKNKIEIKIKKKNNNYSIFSISIRSMQL